MPDISVIIPIYNVEKYLDRCIKSVLNQTYKDIEVILVNDGSPDNCGEICDYYSYQDSRVKVIHKENGGLSDARNAGLDIATGRYIGFIDSDDYIESDMYEELMNAAINNSTEISVCGRYDVHGEDEKQAFCSCGFRKWSSKEAIKNLLLWNNIDSAAWDKIFKRSLFDDVRFPNGKYNEDIFIMCSLIAKSNGVTHIGKPKYYYCHRENSITTEKFSKRKMDLLEANKIVLDLVEKDFPDLLEEAYSFYYKGYIYLLKTIIASKEKNKFLNEYKTLKGVLDKDFMDVIKNQYIDKRNKQHCILLLTNTYNVMDKVWKIYSTLYKKIK